MKTVILKELAAAARKVAAKKVKKETKQTDVQTVESKFNNLFYRVSMTDVSNSVLFEEINATLLRNELKFEAISKHSTATHERSLHIEEQAKQATLTAMWAVAIACVTMLALVVKCLL
jgi:hypothetical protein